MAQVILRAIPDVYTINKSIRHAFLNSNYSTADVRVVRISYWESISCSFLSVPGASTTSEWMVDSGIPRGITARLFAHINVHDPNATGSSASWSTVAAVQIRF